MNERLTEAVLETITSDRRMAPRALEIARSIPTQGRLAHQVAEDIGKAIRITIGERLSDRFVGVQKDGISDCLWMTFMANVSWDQVGRYYLEDAYEKDDIADAAALSRIESSACDG